MKCCARTAACLQQKCFEVTFLEATTVKRFVFASENIPERPVFCREELFAFFIFTAIFIMGVSNVGGATIMNEQRV